MRGRSALRSGTRFRDSTSTAIAKSVIAANRADVKATGSTARQAILKTVNVDAQRATTTIRAPSTTSESASGRWSSGAASAWRLRSPKAPVFPWAIGFGDGQASAALPVVRTGDPRGGDDADRVRDRASAAQ